MPHNVFPWRRGNALTLLIDGPQFFVRMLARIDAAQRQVELELYLVESGACSRALIDSLCAAAQRGVAVRCLLDAFGGGDGWDAARHGLRQRHAGGAQRLGRDGEDQRLNGGEIGHGTGGPDRLGQQGAG